MICVGDWALKRSMRVCAAVALAGATVGLADRAMAQDATMTTPGGTIVTIGGGFQALQLPDMDFTFLTSRA